MGGFNSGRPARRATIEGTHALVLDALAVMRPFAATLAREAIAGPVTLRPRTTHWTLMGEPYAAAVLTLTFHPGGDSGTLRIQHGDVHQYGHPPQDYIVTLDTTCPPYGGRQWWFLCPTAGRRCRKLFLPNGGDRFASRQAYRLHYRSQAEGPVDRAHRRIRRISRRLGGPSSAMLEDLPRKPKGMRRLTYEGLLEQAWAAQDLVDAAFCGWTDRFMERLSRRRGR